MARPKGKIQKRDDSKYWLPEGVSFIDDMGNPNYRKEDKVKFECSKYGEFINTFKEVQRAGASTHPEAVKERRVKTNLKKYGVENAGGTKQSRKKVQETMKKKYGVSHALQSDEFLEKSRQTSRKNFGTDHPMQNPKIKEQLRQSFIDTLGVDNPMKLEKTKEKIRRTSIKRYDVDNPSKNPIIKEKILKGRLKSETIKTSKIELELLNYIKSLDIDGKKGYIGGSDPKELDIKIKEKDMAFEMNGAYYHSELILKREGYKNYARSYHLNKTRMCKEKGIRLIHIWDYEWETRKSQLKSFIRSSLGKNSIRINARDCKVKEVNKQEAKEFLNRYHIQGSSKFIKALGLYYKNELLSLVAIGNHHRQGNNNQYILQRYVCKEDITIIGGLSRLSTHAKREFGEIYTFIDLRFSDGSNWERCGWEIVSSSGPDYNYFDTVHSKFVSKQSRQKRIVKTPEGMTEKQHALQDGLYRIWDCGKLKLKF